MPPRELTQRAYACAMAGIPGILVVRVPSGAQVITVIGSCSPEPAPGREPQPDSSDAMTAVHAAAAVAEACGKWRGEERRRPVMTPQPSARGGTGE
ncbi:hypothetical protein GCM10010341_40500 [Streptomyces noursei]|nr:hypothetical protein GCM10010341_40500 [Streptomyces noursei]